MQPLRHIRLAAALVVAATAAGAALGTGLATASVRTHRSSHIRASQAQSSPACARSTCMACPKSICMQVIPSDQSTFQVQTVVPAGALPTTDNGTLNWAQEPDSQTN